MGKSDDKFKVKLVTDDFLISQKKDNVLVIEQKDKAKENKPFIETPFFTSLLVPVIVLIVGLLIK